MSIMQPTRRQALMGAAALPLISSVLPLRARAGAEMKGASTPVFNRFVMGEFEVTTLLAGAASRDNPHGIFGMNVSDEEFTRVSEENFLPADKVHFFFTPTLVNTGSELILFDTGLNGAQLTGVMAEAGYLPDQVDIVVITHMHGDHIGGMMTDGRPTFANARYVTGAIEHNHWSGADNDGFKNNIAPMNDKFTFLDDGGSVASGVTAMAAFGHTPGHMTYMLESGGRRMLLMADLANHYVWSLAYPDWEVRFDMDKAGAAASRRRILNMLAADRIAFIGYHMPFPSMGYVEADGGGFRYVPASYQMML